jgi:hypothetical protein
LVSPLGFLAIFHHGEMFHLKCESTFFLCAVQVSREHRC